MLAVTTTMRNDCILLCCRCLSFVRSNVVQSVSIGSGHLQGTYRAHSDLVSAMCTFQGAANNTLIVSASFDGQVDVWDPVSHLG